MISHTDFTGSTSFPFSAHSHLYMLDPMPKVIFYLSPTFQENPSIRSLVQHLTIILSPCHVLSHVHLDICTLPVN